MNPMTMAVPSDEYNSVGTTSDNNRPWDRALLTHRRTEAKKLEQNTHKTTKLPSKTINTLCPRKHLAAQGGYSTMNSNTMSNKRTNGNDTIGLKKAKASSATIMDLENKKLNNPYKPPTKEATIDVSPNPQYHDIQGQFDNTELDGKTPYTAMFGEHPEAFHDDLSRVSKALAKLHFNVVLLTTTQQTDVKNNKLSCTDWVSAGHRLLKLSDADAKILPNDRSIRAKAILSRLSFTPPKNILEQIIREKSTPTLHAKMWYTANTLLGSWYDKRKPSIQTTISDAFGPKKTSPSEKDNADHPTSTEGVSFANIASRKPSTLDNTKPKTALRNSTYDQKAYDTAIDLSHTRRYAMRLQIPADKKKTATEHFLSIIREIFKEIKDIDEAAIIMPWNESESSSLPAITKPRDIPSKLAKFRPYVDRAKPKSGKMCFFQMRLACDSNPDEFLSKDRSSLKDTWDEYEGGAYYCAVQDSDDAVELCYLIYQGAFSDHQRMTEEIRNASLLDKHNKTNKPYKLGVRVKKNKDVEIKDSKRTDWTMMESQMAIMEVDRDHLKRVKNFLYKTINQGPMGSIGGYNTRILPVQNQITSGTSGARNHINMLKKHQAVILNLDLHRVTSIKYLDKPVSIGSNEYSLRQILQLLTFPLRPTEEQTSEPLLHSVDYATDNKNAAKGVVYVTAYKDRSELAGKLMEVLPAYLVFAYGRTIANQMVHSSALHECPTVDWGTDSLSDWNGNWQTEEEQQLQVILDEQMGNTEFHIENLDLVSDDNNEHIITAENQSFATYGSALIAHGNQPQSEDEATLTGEPDAQLHKSTTGGLAEAGGSAM